MSEKRAETKDTLSFLSHLEEFHTAQLGKGSPSGRGGGGGFPSELGPQQLRCLPRHQGTEAWADSQPPACHAGRHPSIQAGLYKPSNLQRTLVLLPFPPTARQVAPRMLNRPAPQQGPRVESRRLGGSPRRKENAPLASRAQLRPVLWPVWAGRAALFSLPPCCTWPGWAFLVPLGSTGPLEPRALT